MQLYLTHTGLNVCYNFARVYLRSLMSYPTSSYSLFARLPKVRKYPLCEAMYAWGKVGHDRLNDSYLDGSELVFFDLMHIDPGVLNYEHLCIPNRYPWLYTRLNLAVWVRWNKVRSLPPLSIESLVILAREQERCISFIRMPKPWPSVKQLVLRVNFSYVLPLNFFEAFPNLEDFALETVGSVTGPPYTLEWPVGKFRKLCVDGSHVLAPTGTFPLLRELKIVGYPFMSVHPSWIDFQQRHAPMLERLHTVLPLGTTIYLRMTRLAIYLQHLGGLAQLTPRLHSVHVIDVSYYPVDMNKITFPASLQQCTFERMTTVSMVELARHIWTSCRVRCIPMQWGRRDEERYDILLQHKCFE